MPPMELDESDSIAPLYESLLSMPSDDDEEQQYWKMRSIYRVPTHITALNREAYRPQVVSFGPYHHRKPCLLPMEAHKLRAVRHFLKRSKKPIEPFLESLREVEGDLKENYDVLDPKWKAGSSEGVASPFLELMIIDGCFMLEILRFDDNKVHNYAPNDPIFSNHGEIHIMPYIREDMLMLENQLPMQVLERLVAVQSDGNEDNESINRLILNFCLTDTRIKRMGKCLHVLDVFRKHMLTEPEKDEEDGFVKRLILKFCSPSKGIARMGKWLHLLDVFRKCMLKESDKDKVESWYNRGTIKLASASKLSEHGIRFKSSKTDSLKDISFVGSILRLPRIMVHDGTKSMLLNLMAFERSHVKAGIEVTSYIYFMTHIINKGQDVMLLRAEGIILNYQESNEAVAKIINSLDKGATIDGNSSLLDVLNGVDKYCNKRWNMWRANLIHTYFRNPWVALSLIGAVFLFALTAIQTVYSVLGSHK